MYLETQYVSALVLSFTVHTVQIARYPAWNANTASDFRIVKQRELGYFLAMIAGATSQQTHWLSYVEPRGLRTSDSLWDYSHDFVFCPGNLQNIYKRTYICRNTYKYVQAFIYSIYLFIFKTHAWVLFMLSQPSPTVFYNLLNTSSWNLQNFHFNNSWFITI